MNKIRALMIPSLLTFAGATALSTGAHAVSATTATFDGGSDDGFTGNVFFEAADGNPDGNAHMLLQAFGLSLRTGGVGEPANAGFLGDYTAFPSVTLSFDIRVDSITDFIGNQIPREIGISLIDRDQVGPNGSAGVYVSMDVVSASTHSDWVTVSTTIDDTSATQLPPGWIGFGDEDPNTFEPILPDGVTFASVLASVDQFEITTFVPGFFFTFANYDLRVDNISIQPVPVPPALLLFVSGLALLVRRRKAG